MRTVRSLAMLVVGVAVLVGGVHAGWAQQSVHPYKLKATVSDDEMIDGDLVILKAKLTSGLLVQLARGRSLDEKPPGNEILAVVVDCGTSPTPFVTQIVVWDTDQEMVLVEVSEEITTDDSIFQSKGGAMNIVEAQFVAEISINANGAVGVNAIDGGDWVASGVAKIDTKSPDGCPKSVKTTLLGTLDVTVTDEDGTIALETLVTKASGTASKGIAFLP